MLIVKKIRRNEDGNYDTAWNLSDEQMNFLLTYAINELLSRGLVEVKEEEVDEAQMQMDFLESVNPEHLNKA